MRMMVLGSGPVASENSYEFGDLSEIFKRVPDCRIGIAAQQIEVEKVLPGLTAKRSRFDFGEIQVTQCEACHGFK